MIHEEPALPHIEDDLQLPTDQRAVIIRKGEAPVATPTPPARGEEKTEAKKQEGREAVVRVSPTKKDSPRRNLEKGEIYIPHIFHQVPEKELRKLIKYATKEYGVEVRAARLITTTYRAPIKDGSREAILILYLENGRTYFGLCYVYEQAREKVGRYRDMTPHITWVQAIRNVPAHSSMIRRIPSEFLNSFDREGR